MKRNTLTLLALLSFTISCFCGNRSYLKNTTPRKITREKIEYELNPSKFATMIWDKCGTNLEVNDFKSRVEKNKIRKLRKQELKESLKKETEQRQEIGKRILSATPDQRLTLTNKLLIAIEAEDAAREKLAQY